MVKFKIDSGTEINVIPRRIYNKLHWYPKLKSTSVTLTAYNNTSIPVVGKFIVSVTYTNVISPVKFIIGDTNSQAVLVPDTHEKLQLIKRIFSIKANLPELLDKCRYCFSEIETLGTTHHITVDPSFFPLINHPKKILFALKNQKVEPSVKTFYNIRVAISMLNGLLLKGNRIIIRTDLHGEVQNLINSRH